MTSPTMRRVLSLCLALASTAALAGCGDHRLTVSGHARLENAATDLRTGFAFPTDVRIDGDATEVTGTCQIRPIAGAASAGGYVVAVDLFGSGAGPRSISVIGRTDAASSTVEVQTASAVYRAEATCVVDVAYVDEGGSATLEAHDCAMTSDAGSAAFDAHLELHGCSVVDVD